MESPVEAPAGLSSSGHPALPAAGPQAFCRQPPYRSLQGWTLLCSCSMCHLQTTQAAFHKLTKHLVCSNPGANRTTGLCLVHSRWIIATCFPGTSTMQEWEPRRHKSETSVAPPHYRGLRHAQGRS